MNFRKTIVYGGSFSSRLLLALVCLVIFTGFSVCCKPATRQKKLNKLGNVSIIYEASRDSIREAFTKYKYRWKRKFRYSTSLSSYNGQLLLTISVKGTDVAEVSHTIYMPEKGRARPWYARLLDHEYDHIAISADKRPGLLLSHLVANFKIKNIKVKSARAVTRDLILFRINERMNQYEDAVEDLIKKNYELLDHPDVSDHGKADIPNRKEFFKSLYTRKMLLKHKFKYLEKVRTLLVSEKYTRIDPYDGWR